MGNTTHDILTDERGVSIVFAVILVVVLLVIGGILVTTGYANFSRATTDRPAAQNEKTVASAAAFVQGKMNGATVAAVSADDLSQGFASADVPWIEHLLKKDGGSVTLSVQGDGLPANALRDVTVASKQNGPTTYRIFVYVAGEDGKASDSVMKFDVTVGYQASAASGTLSATTPLRAGDGS